jgi:hypothetical protein
VLRFWNNEALTNIESVLEVILESAQEPAPHPSLSLRGGEQFAPESEE